MKINLKKATKAKSKSRQRRVVTTKSSKQPPKQRVSTAAIQKTLCSLNDPFCSHAQGSQWRTGSRVRSMPFQLHSSITLTTNSAGFQAVMFVPAYTSAWAINTSTTYPCVFNNLVPTYNPLTPQQYRIVSFGVIVRKTVTPLNAGGIVRVRTFNADNGGAFNTVDPQTFRCAEYQDIALSDCKELALVSRIYEPVEAQKFRPKDELTTINTWENPGFTPFLIAVTGAAASTPVVEIEIIANYELVFADDDAMSLAAKAVPPTNPVLSAAQEAVSSSMQTFAIAGVKSFSSMVARKAATAVAGYFGGPAAAGAANLMIRDVD